MISGWTLMPSFCTIGGGLEHRARLHRGDLGIADAEAAAAEAEHRVELVQLLDALSECASTGTPSFFASSACCSLRVRQELVQRRIEEADRRRVALQRPEDAGEIVALIRQQLGERRLPRLERLGEDHLAHRVDAVALEEHVLGAAEADADGAERDRVRASARACRRWCGRCMRVACAHHFISCWKFLNFSVFFAASSPWIRPGDDLRRRGLDLAGVDLAGGAVDRQPVAFLERLAVRP